MNEKRTEPYIIWVMYPSALPSTLRGLKAGEYTEVRESLKGMECGPLRVWYMKNGELKSHLYMEGELNHRAMGESWIPAIGEIRE